MFCAINRKSLALRLLIIMVFLVGALAAQSRERQSVGLANGQVVAGGRSGSPVPTVVHVAPSGRTSLPRDLTAEVNPSTQTSPSGGHSSFGYYYWNPFSRFYGYGLCGSFYGLLYSRYSGVYPDLFHTVRSSRDLYLTEPTVKAALRDSVHYATRMDAAYNNLKGLADGSIGASLSPRARKKEMKEVINQIRFLSNQIKNDPFLYMLDRRKDRDVLKATKNPMNQEEDLQQLGELIAGLREELRNFHESPNVISVKSYKAPPVRSLAKGIDKLAKRIT
ncbi:MAG: hypothetical protein HYR55_09665 [Acidobacteria bacterium]|nr:hypothetical protein [Acidobacteriota bacterium]MBI3656750.1 hypothetical protein [Acidobacteriota bacterium]